SPRPAPSTAWRSGTISGAGSAFPARSSFRRCRHSFVAVGSRPDTGGCPGFCPYYYKNRWQVELFFKWIKQHLRIKQFYGTSENAVKTQIWIAVSVYVLVAIVRKRLGLEASLYTLMQVLSVTIFEKMPLQTALSSDEPKSDTSMDSNQLNLFGF